MCDFGAHAGADVASQGLHPQPQGLFDSNSLPEMATNGDTPRYGFEERTGLEHVIDPLRQTAPSLRLKERPFIG